VSSAVNSSVLLCVLGDSVVYIFALLGGLRERCGDRILATHNEPYMIDFTHKIILITGAAAETGQELAVELARRGASIAAVDINPSGWRKPCAASAPKAARSKDYVVDTSQAPADRGPGGRGAGRLGRIDILVCAAVVRPPTDPEHGRVGVPPHAGREPGRTVLSDAARRASLMKAHGGGTIVVAHRGRSADLPPSQPAHPPQANEDAGRAAYFASQAALDAAHLDCTAGI